MRRRLIGLGSRPESLDIYPLYAKRTPNVRAAVRIEMSCNVARKIVAAITIEINRTAAVRARVQHYCPDLDGGLRDAVGAGFAAPLIDWRTG
jgi:hypothetical protein